jgi:hypothetical protein
MFGLDEVWCCGLSAAPEGMGMSDFGEAMGTAAEGGLFSKVVGRNGSKGIGGDPTPLEKGHFAEGICLNCGTSLIGSHCHECGQQAHLHRTIGAFMHDLLHGALHFEGRTWKTLPKLFFKPGELTRRYIDGERARFVSPMALFLFSIFLMFAIFQVAGISTPTDMSSPNAEVRERAEGARDTLEAELATTDPSDSERRAELETEIAGLGEAIEFIETGRDYDFVDRDGKRAYSTMNLTGIEAIDQGIVAKWRKNPGLMLYKLQTNFYKFSWLLIPLSIPFVWLLFAWRRRFKAYDHAIFVTYSLSFMSLLILAVTLAGLAGLHTALIALALMIVPPLHIYKQLRGAYGLSRFSALWRLAVLTVFIMVILTLFLQLLLVMGAF